MLRLIKSSRLQDLFDTIKNMEKDRKLKSKEIEDLRKELLNLKKCHAILCDSLIAETNRAYELERKLAQEK